MQNDIPRQCRTELLCHRAEGEGGHSPSADSPLMELELRGKDVTKGYSLNKLAVRD